MAEAGPIVRELVCKTPDETRALGQRLGEAAEAGDVFLLDGAFGSGKTVLVQGLAAGLGVESYVASPSFIIVNQHQGRLRLYHVDLFRLEKLDAELEDTLADVVDASGVVAIEWPGLVPGYLRQGANILHFRRGADESRIIRLEAASERLARAFSPRASESAGQSRSRRRSTPGKPDAAGY